MAINVEKVALLRSIANALAERGLADVNLFLMRRSSMRSVGDPGIKTG